MQELGTCKYDQKICIGGSKKCRRQEAVISQTLKEFYKGFLNKECIAYLPPTLVVFG